MDVLLDKPELYKALVFNPQYAVLHKTNETLKNNLKMIAQLSKEFLCWYEVANPFQTFKIQISSF